MIPKTTIRPDEKAALQTLKLLEKLEELDDVSNVASNADFPDDMIEKLAAQM
jgi:transcriptional/translational regulatory protein YebC/TACO1